MDDRPREIIPAKRAVVKHESLQVRVANCVLVVNATLRKCIWNIQLTMAYVDESAESLETYKRVRER